jgi:hypothetical protein
MRLSHRFKRKAKKSRAVRYVGAAGTGKTVKSYG